MKGVKINNNSILKENEAGEIKQIEAPIHHSNVKLNVKQS